MASRVNLARRPAGLLMFGLVAIALYNLVPAAILQSIIYEGLGTIAAVAIAVRACRCQGRARIGFALIAVGVGCWVSGDAATDVLRFTSSNASVPYPSIADAMYLLGYGIALGGATILARDVFGRRPLLPLIDGAIAAATFLGVAWAAMHAGRMSAGSSAETLGVLSYPTLDVLALAAGVRMFSDRLRSRPLLVVAAGLLAMLGADCGYAVSAMNYTVGGAIDNGWLIAYLCFALVACSPVAAVTRAVPEELRFRPFRLAMVGLALVATNVATTIGAHAVDTDGEMIIMGFCSVALAGLVIARMAVVLRAYDRARCESSAPGRVGLPPNTKRRRPERNWRLNMRACSNRRAAFGRSSNTRDLRWRWSDTTGRYSRRTRARCACSGSRATTCAPSAPPASRIPTMSTRIGSCSQI